MKFMRVLLRVRSELVYENANLCVTALTIGKQ